MEFVAFFTRLFSLTFGVFAALVLAFYIIWPKIENYILKLNNINQHKSQTKAYRQLTFAAYERLILLVHRISPQQVMLRHHDVRISVVQFRQIVISDIENEYQHNFTQQLYVSDAAWTTVRDLKDSTITLLRNASSGLGENASLDDYIAIVLRHINELDTNPYDAAQILLKRELNTY